MKKGTPAFCESIDGTGEYYAKWNKPVGKRQIPYDLTYKWNLMKKIEQQVWKYGTDWKQPERRGKGDNHGKKGKGWNKEHVWITHRHGQ